MTLDREGREEILFPFTANVADLSGAEVNFTGTTWHAATIEDGNVVVLCAGPDALDNPPGTIVLPVGVHHVRIRFTDDPQALIRGGGHVLVA